MIKKHIPKIAVIELSTKAVKFLTGDQEKILAHGFDFSYFERESFLVHAGKLLDEDNFMDVNKFRHKVLPSIQKMYKLCEEKSVEEVYTVATAAYRSAKNREEILKIIEEEVGLEVRILSKEEETRASVNAFFFSKPREINIQTPIFCFIDQGGGSTEISFFTNPEKSILTTYGLDLGTTVLHNIFFTHCTKDTPFEEAFQSVDQKTRERLKYYFSRHAPDKKNMDCIAVGTAITNAAGPNNKKQHGKILTMEKLMQKVKEAQGNLQEVFDNLYDLQKHLQREIGTHGISKNGVSVDKEFSMRLGLPMFIEIVKYFQIPRIIVSGTGLWYGIYLENLMERKE